MSIAGDIVDVVMRAITGGVEMTAAAREAAKRDVIATLGRASDLDRRELLGLRADAVGARHTSRVRAIASAIAASASDRPPPDERRGNGG